MGMGMVVISIYSVDAILGVDVLAECYGFIDDLILEHIQIQTHDAEDCKTRDT